MVKATKNIFAISAPVTITAGETVEANGKTTSGPAKFASTFYTGGKLDIAGWDAPVVVDLAALSEAKVLVANLDHDQTKRVGNFSVANDKRSLVASGTATAKTAARDEVVESALAGYQWQSSLEVQPRQSTLVKAGTRATVNGQEQEGPFYRVAGTLKGFGFVSHGADDNTNATIAASAASTKGNAMDAACKTWIEGMLPGVDIDTLPAEALTNLEQNFKGQNGRKPKVEASANPFEARKIEAKRRTELREVSDKFIERRKNDLEYIESIEKLHDHAIEAGMSVQEFRNELYESNYPAGHTVISHRKSSQISQRVLEAAVCEAGHLDKIDKQYSDQELQAARDEFPHGITLNQLLLISAKANGWEGGSCATKVTLEAQRAAFGMIRQASIQAAGFSTYTISNIISNIANKFLFQGWMAVDSTWSRISSTRSVNDFKTITTISLTGHLQYDQLGPAGEIKHGTIADMTYTNQAKTYAAMLAIKREDIVNDDLGALTMAPRRLGRGAALKLNDIFWTMFLNNSSFFTSGNLNVSTGGGSALGTADGAAINAAEVKFMNQTDPDGKPLGIMPAIMLVPPTLKNTAARWMGSQLFTPSGTAGLGATNIFGGRYTVESSPYMENSTYTGNSTAAWYLLCNPADLSTIEVAALNGRVEPVVETADADFNVLGIQMRGYSDVGVNLQEFRAGVRSAGS